MKRTEITASVAKKARDTKPKKKVAPNDPCTCGSGKKYKSCCGAGK